MQTVSMHEAKSNLFSLIESLQSGAVDEVIIARDGKPAARLTPTTSPKQYVYGGLQSLGYAFVIWE